MKLLFFLTSFLFTAGVLGIPAQGTDKGSLQKSLGCEKISDLNPPKRHGVGSRGNPVVSREARAAKRANQEEEEIELYVRRMGLALLETTRDWFIGKEFLLIAQVSSDNKLRLHVSTSERKKRQDANAIVNNGPTSNPGAAHVRLYMFGLQHWLDSMNYGTVDTFDWKAYYTLGEGPPAPEAIIRVFLTMEWQTRQLHPTEVRQYVNSIATYIRSAGAQLHPKPGSDPRIGADQATLNVMHNGVRLACIRGDSFPGYIGKYPTLRDLLGQE